MKHLKALIERAVWIWHKPGNSLNAHKLIARRKRRKIFKAAIVEKISIHMCIRAKSYDPQFINDDEEITSSNSGDSHYRFIEKLFTVEKFLVRTWEVK